MRELGTCEEALQQMGRVVEDRLLEELLSLSRSEGVLPLSDWPNNINKNWFSDVVHFAHAHSPVTLSFILRITKKDIESNVSPADVVNIATIYAQMAHLVDQSNNVLAKMNTIQLKMEGCTDEGINALAKLNLTQTARNLRNLRDDFAEVAEKLLEEETKEFPDQKTLDNCDQKGANTTVEYRETEMEDTTNLNTDGMAPEEVAKLFTPELITMTEKDLESELKEYGRVMAIAVGRKIGINRPNTPQLEKFLPEHHTHKWSNLPIRPAKITLVPPHYFKETVISETIQMAVELQREFLDLIKKQQPNNLQFAKDLEHIYRAVVEEEEQEDKSNREQAEFRVQLVCKLHGENIMHGDLLTFQKFRQAELMRVSSVRAVDRLEYIGIFRMQLFHLVMSKTCQVLLSSCLRPLASLLMISPQDIKACMPDRNKVGDKGSLGHAAAVMGINGWFSNDKKKVVRCGNFERHQQHNEAWQMAQLLNMFDNFFMLNPDSVAEIKSEETAVLFIQNMLLHYGALWYWDPKFVDPQTDFKCDAFLASRDAVIRLVIDLTFEQCERENDAVVLRALRRVMIPMFLMKSKAQTSKYARYTLMDLVIELSASERSQVRMEHLVTTNPSGTRGGGMFRDKWNEVMVRLVKDAIRRQHSALRDLQIQTLIKSLSVMDNLHRHNLKSRLYETKGRQRSGDLVGKQRWELLTEITTEVNPFNLSREMVSDFELKSKGSPFVGLKIPELQRFMTNVKRDFILCYPELSCKPSKPSDRV